MIEGIYLDKKNLTYRDYTVEGNDQTFLSPLSRFNILIGANNAGKSRMLRELFLSFQRKHNESEFKLIPENLPFKDIDIPFLKKEFFIAIIREILNRTSNIENTQIVEKIRNPLEKIIELLNQSPYGKVRYSLILEIENELHSIERKIERDYFDIKDEDRIPGKAHIRGVGSIESRIMNVFREGYSKIEKITGQESYKLQYHTTYIPALRSIKRMSNDALRTRVELDYFPNIPNLNIFSGEDLFKRISTLRNGSSKQTKLLRDFEKFISKTFFENRAVEILTPHEQKDNHNSNSDLYIKIGSEKEYPVWKLGDGILSVILLTYPYFERRNEAHIVFIEEPELYLHPGYQRIFLEAVSGNHFPQTQTIITSHSNHFLDMTMESNNNSTVYAFKKNDDELQADDYESSFTIENVIKPGQSLLELIGAKNSSVFLTNSTIWVEGITDRVYLSHYLKIYQKAKSQEAQLQNQTLFIAHEDLHFSFMEYGGNNITHWSFLDDETEDLNTVPRIDVNRFCAKAFLVADSDGYSLGGDEKGKKQKRLDTLKETLKERFYLLQAKEIENLLQPKIIEAVLRDLEKKDSSSIAFNFKQEDYKDEKLGKFIEEKVTGIKRSYSEKSGTLKEKLAFAQHSVEKVQSKEDMSAEAWELTEKVYNFIAEMNR